MPIYTNTRTYKYKVVFDRSGLNRLYVLVEVVVHHHLVLQWHKFGQKEVKNRLPIGSLYNKITFYTILPSIFNLKCKNWLLGDRCRVKT